MERLVVTLKDVPPAALEGRTFQIHILPNNSMLLYPVEIAPADTRCPVLVGGERCGLAAGHDGKHAWGSGD